MSDSNTKGYYILYDYPKELKTDQSYTYKMTTSGDDMTGVTYSFGWKFICDGVTTENVVASGLTSLTYTWTPTSAIFGPLMTKSKSGILKVIVETSTGQMAYIMDIPLTISDDIRPSISNCVIDRTAYDYNGKSISNMTIHKLNISVSGLYGASQTAIISVGDATNTIKIDTKTGNQISTASLELGAFDAGAADSIEKTVNITVTDSRGFSTSTTASVTIYSYTPPMLTASVYRTNNQDAYISFTTNFQGTVAGKTNSIKTFYARCTTGTDMVQTDLKTSPQKLNGTDALENSYNVFVLLMDDVGGKDIKRFVLPSVTPVMDIGADGKTVAFFGTAPETADDLSLKVKDIASFGETIRLGKTDDSSRTLISTEGMSIYDGDEEMVHFGRAGEGWTNDDPLSPRGYHFSFGSRVADTSSRNSAMYSFTAGNSLQPTRNYQTVIGEYNSPDSDGSSLFTIGNGSSDSDRSNIFTVTSADANVNGTLWVNKDSDSSAACLTSDSDGGFLNLIGGNGHSSAILSTNADGELIISTADRDSSNKLYGFSAFTFSPYGKLKIDGRDICENKVLWTGGYHMSDSHTAYLDEAISDQPHGIVLVFREIKLINNSWTIQNSGLHTYFVPKQLVSDANGWGHSISWAHHNGSYYITKYLYIFDSYIKGNALNSVNSTPRSPSGITVTPKTIVLWEVIGV